MARNLLPTWRLGAVPLVLLSGSSAFAQSTVRPVPLLVTAEARRAATEYERLAAVPEREEVRWDFDVRLGATHQAAAGLEGVGGDLSTQRGGWNVDMHRDAGDRATTLHLASEFSFYDFGAGGPVVPGSADPLNDVYDTSIGVLMRYDESERVGWITGAELTISGEDEVDVGASSTLGALAGVQLRADHDLSMSFGLAARTRLEDDAWIYPYFALDWRVTDSTSLLSRGSDVEVRTDLPHDWQLSLLAEFEMRQFRLNDDNPLPSGVLQDDQISLGAGLTWTPTARTRLELRGGTILWRELDFRDATGASQGELETDPAAFLSIGLTFGN